MSEPTPVSERERIAALLVRVWHESLSADDAVWGEMADAILADRRVPAPPADESTDFSVSAYNPKTWRPIQQAPAPPAEVEAALREWFRVANVKLYRGGYGEGGAFIFPAVLFADLLATVTALVATERERCAKIVAAMGGHGAAEAIRQGPRP